MERIRQRVDDLHEKTDRLAETLAAKAADIVWLKWAVRALMPSVLTAGAVVVRTGLT